MDNSTFPALGSEWKSNQHVELAVFQAARESSTLSPPGKRLLTAHPGSGLSKVHSHRSILATSRYQGLLRVPTPQRQLHLPD